MLRSGKLARSLSSVIAPSTSPAATCRRSPNCAPSHAVSSGASASSTDQTIEQLPSNSGRNASGPVGRNLCQAVFSCARSLRTVATIARWW